MPVRGCVFISVAVMAAASCAPRHIEEVAVPKVKPHDTRQIPAAEGWLPHRVSATSSYLIRDSASVAIKEDSTRPSLLEETMLLIITAQKSGDSLEITARVESLTVTSHSPIQSTVSDSTALRLFHVVATSSGRIISLKGAESTQCLNANDPAVARIFETTLTYPPSRIKAGDTWSDTVSLVTCRGKTMVTQVTTRQYKMLERITSADGNIIKLHRNTATLMSATAVNNSNHLTATGVGSSTATLDVDENTGDLQKSDGESSSIVTVTTSRGTYPFIQHIITHIEKL
ncbi:MAG: hypothetical protein ABI446_04035 [Gemmatimonadaceae bacterium]